LPKRGEDCSERFGSASCSTEYAGPVGFWVVAGRDRRRPPLVITFVTQKIVDGHLTDAATLTALSLGISDLRRDICIAANTIAIEA
jgi:hypothetical protein